MRDICLIISQNLIGVDPHSLRLYNPYFREFFDYLVEEGKDERLAKVACANKFVRVSWAMMQGKMLFSPPTRRKNNVSDDPLAKLKEFLSLNKAEELFEELVQIAKEQLPSHYRSPVQERPSPEKVS